MGLSLLLSEHLFCLSHHKFRWTMSVNNVGLQIYILGSLKLHDYSVIFSLFGVNRSGPRMSSTTNHNFYRAMEQLHVPWCKHPIIGVINVVGGKNDHSRPIYLNNATRPALFSILVCHKGLWKHIKMTRFLATCLVSAKSERT